MLHESKDRTSVPVRDRNSYLPIRALTRFLLCSFLVFHLESYDASMVHYIIPLPDCQIFIDTFKEANLGKTFAEIKQQLNRIIIETSILENNLVQIKIENNGCGLTTLNPQMSTFLKLLSYLIMDTKSEKIIQELEKIYPAIMTKIRFKLSPKPSKTEKENLGKTGFIPVKARLVIEITNSWMERCKSLSKNFG